ncbi:MAG: hypothetical protein NC240_00035 [Clostridium sp.]|nr:hypothetical protein [Clostridium sp.]
MKTQKGNAQVGIWWYTDDGDIWVVSTSKDDGELDGPYLQYSTKENDMTLWRKLVSDNRKSNLEESVSKDYKTLECGRVVYDCRTCCYEVTCSEKLIYDKEFRMKIIDCFELSGNQVEFMLK